MSIGEISLQPIKKADLEFVRKLRNENRKHFFSTKSVTKKDQKYWFDTLTYDFLIIWLGKERVGTISEHAICNIKLTDKRYCGLFEVGNLMLVDKHRGKGYMTEALRLLTLQGGFFVAFVKTRNKVSQKVFERGEFWQAN